MRPTATPTPAGADDPGPGTSTCPAPATPGAVPVGERPVHRRPGRRRHAHRRGGGGRLGSRPRRHRRPPGLRVPACSPCSSTRCGVPAPTPGCRTTRSTRRPGAPARSGPPPSPSPEPRAPSPETRAWRALAGAFRRPPAPPDGRRPRGAAGPACPERVRRTGGERWHHAAPVPRGAGAGGREGGRGGAGEGGGAVTSGHVGRVESTGQSPARKGAGFFRGESGASASGVSTLPAQVPALSFCGGRRTASAKIEMSGRRGTG